MNLRIFSVYLSLAFIVLLTLIALFAPWLAPYSYDAQSIEHIFSEPSREFFFGTDQLGRDLFSRLLYGCRISMSIALITAVSSVAIGTIYGCIAGYVGGWVDRFMMRAIDILYTLPSLIIMILVMLIFQGRDFQGIFISLTITGWLGTARLMRAQVLSWKQRPFVEAAHALGMKAPRIVWKHILPNAIAPIIVELTYQIPTNIFAEAFLSFLGIGIRPPTPSWGVLIDDGWRALQSYPHLIIFPGVLISLTMFSFTIIGDYLRDRLDPFLRGR